jgi:hypothetical protein
MDELRAEFNAELVAARADLQSAAGSGGDTGMLRAEWKQAVAELELRLSNQILELTKQVERRQKALGLIRP